MRETSLRTEVCGVVIGGTIKAQSLQIGDEVRDGAFVDALPLTENVKLQGKEWHQEAVKNKNLSRTELATVRVASRPSAAHSFLQTCTLSNISNSLALGWWMVQMMVRPPMARERSKDTTWWHDTLSNPLNATRGRGEMKAHLNELVDALELRATFTWWVHRRT